MLDDRGQVNVVDVVIPIDDAGVEVEVALVVSIECVPQAEQVVDLVDRFALGVQAIQLDVFERPLDVLPLRFQFGGEVGLLATQGECLQRLLGGSQHLLGSRQLLLNASATGELPFGDDDRLAVFVVQRIVGEELGGPVDHGPVAQWVDAT